MKKTIVSLFMVIVIVVFSSAYSQIKATEEIKKVSTFGMTRGVNSFNLTSDVSDSELTNYTDTVTLNFSIKHIDSTSGLYKGVLVIDFGQDMLEVTKFAANATANPNITSASMNYVTNKLTVNLKSPIPTGATFDYSVIARISGGADADTAMNATATLSGENASKVLYTPETNTTSDVTAKIPGKTTIDPANPQWKLMNSQRNANVVVGASIEPSNELRLPLGNASFKNLRLVWKKGNTDSILVYNSATSARRISKANNTTGVRDNMDVFPVKNSNSPTSVEYEYGAINGNIYNAVGISPTGFMKIPLDAVPGTVYSSSLDVYDDDNFLYSYTMNITVIDTVTTVAMNPSISTKEIKNNGYFDWFDQIDASSGGSGIKNLETTLDVSEGLVPQGLYLITAGTKIKKLDIYQNGEWINIPEVSITSEYFDDFSKYTANGRIEKIRYQRADAPNVSVWTPLFIRFKGENIIKDNSYSIKVSNQTYLDHTDTLITSDISAAKYNKVLNGVDLLTNKANIAAAVVKNAGSPNNDFAQTKFNGDTILQVFSLHNNLSELENPYLFIKIPKGVDATTNINIGQTNSMNFAYGMPATDIQMSGSITKPKGRFDFKTESLKLADGSTFIYYKLDDGVLLSGPESAQNTERIQFYMSLLLSSVASGNYDVEFGAGSLTTDDYTINHTQDSNVSYTMGKLENIPQEYKDIIPGLTSSKYLTSKKSFSVGINNSVNTKMEIKGSEDATYIDAATKTATSIPGQAVDYKVTLTNGGTNELTNFQAIDILPHVGDKSITNPGTARGSLFNVNLGSSIKLLVDGVETDDAYIEYSTSQDPIRFDNDGNEIGTGEWSSTPPSDMSDVKSIKVVMPSKPFAIGSSIQILFSGTVPVDAPRAGEIAYNTIALKANTITSSGVGIFTSEPAKGGVKSKAPATNLELSGETYIDFDKNGAITGDDVGYNGVTLNLYKNIGGVFVKSASVNSAPNSSNVAGKFAFTGITPGTYKIEAVLKSNTQFIVAGDNGFEIQTDPKLGWLKRNGSTEFTIDDIGLGNPLKMTDFKAPFFVATPFNGSIKFVDKNGDIITSNTYGQSFTIQLQTADKVDVNGATTTSLADGSFSIADSVVKSKADFYLKFTKPTGKAFTYPSANNINLDKTNGTYYIKDVIPGTNGIADILISDTDNPTMSITKNKAYNPTSITLSPSDVTTNATGAWKIKLNGTQINEGTGAVTIPTTEGVYTIEAIATDAAKNVSTTQTDTFTIDNTKPVISVSSLPVSNFNLTKLDVSVTDNMDTATKISYVLTNTTTNVTQTITNVTGLQDLTSKITIDGTYTLVVNATDAAGNEAITVNKAFTIDTTKPVLTVASLPVSNFNLTKLDISVSDNIDTATKISYVLTNTTTNVTQTITDVTGLQDLTSKIMIDGVYTLVVNAKDAANNAAIPVNKSFTIDKTNPVISTSLNTKSVKIGTSPINILNTFSASALDAITGNISAISVEGTYDLNKVGSYSLIFKATDLAGNTGQKSVTLVVEKITISGNVFEDKDYNSLKNDNASLSGITITLVDNDTDTQVATTTSNASGNYSFALPGTETVTDYAIKVSEPDDYLLANKSSDSKIALTTMKSDTMQIKGLDYLNQDIGVAKDISVVLSPLNLRVYKNDTVTSNLTLTNGSIDTIVKNNEKVNVTSKVNGIDFKGLDVGTSQVTIAFKNGYGRASLSKQVDLNVLALPTMQANDKQLIVSQTSNLIYTSTPSDGVLNFSSSFAEKATVNQNGMIKALERGSSIIESSVTTNDSEAKKAFNKAVVSIGLEKMPTVANNEAIDSIDFEMKASELKKASLSTLIKAGNADAWSVDVNTLNKDIKIVDAKISKTQPTLSNISKTNVLTNTNTKLDTNYYYVTYTTNNKTKTISKVKVVMDSDLPDGGSKLGLVSIISLISVLGLSITKRKYN